MASTTGDDAELKLADFIARADGETLPPDVVEAAKMVLLDTLGVMLAATTLEETVVPLFRLAQEGGGRQESSLIGFGGKVPCWMAAFANGSLSHALDYSSSNDRGVAPGGVTVPAALAMAERIPGTTGSALVTAIAMGNEAVMRIGGAIRRNPMDFGWVSPMLLGVFGAAVAAGKVAGLTGRQLVDAMAIALHQAGGTWEMAEDGESNFRAVRNSLVNKNGVLAVLMAQRGISAASHPLTGRHGLYRQYYQGDYDPSVLFEGLGTDFHSSRISFKPYPSCRATHTSIDATLKLARLHDIAPEDVEEVRLTVGPAGEGQCLPAGEKNEPKTSIEAKFSLPFTVATALARRKVTLDDFTPASIRSPAITDLAWKVKYQVRKDAPRLNTGIVEVRMKDGRNLREEVPTPLGNPANPLSREQLQEKFRDCASFSVKPLGATEVNEIIGYVADLEKSPGLSPLMELIS